MKKKLIQDNSNNPKYISTAELEERMRILARTLIKIVREKKVVQISNKV